MTRQAIQLGLLPRINVSQTSAESYGQIYVGFVNWALMALTLVLTITFRSSDNLAAAFGIAVSMTMLLTSVLMFIAMREVWRWSLPVSLLVAGLFIIVDGSFVAANMVKFFEGGWIPLVVASILFFLMTCWSEGFAALRAALERDTFPLQGFIAKFHGKPRVEGTAVYLSGRMDVVPVPLLHNLKHNKVLHERIVLLRVLTEHVPRVDPARRVETTELADGFHAMTAALWFHGPTQHTARPHARIRRLPAQLQHDANVVFRRQANDHSVWPLEVVEVQAEYFSVHAPQRAFGDRVFPDTAGARRRAWGAG